MPPEKVFQETRRSKKAEIQAQASVKRSNDERTNNDPKHTSRYIQGFFAEKVITWWRSPAESPDLNPIELVWGAYVCYFCGLPHGALTVFAVYRADVKQIFRGFPYVRLRKNISYFCHVLYIGAKKLLSMRLSCQKFGFGTFLQFN